MNRPKDIEEACKKLKPEIGDKADNLWYMYLAEDDKGKKDLALDIDIISEKILKKNPLAKNQILLEPPSVKKSKGSFLIGNVVYNNKKLNHLYLRHEDFIKQVGIFAVTGEDKYRQAQQQLQTKLKKDAKKQAKARMNNLDNPQEGVSFDTFEHTNTINYSSEKTLYAPDETRSNQVKMAAK